MSKLKDLVIDIQDMALNGYDAEDIAVILEVDLSLVDDVLKSMDDSGYDGQPDEAQEWYDFDPDC